MTHKLHFKDEVVLTGGGMKKSPSMTGLNTLTKKLSSQEDVISHLSEENRLAREILDEQHNVIMHQQEQLRTQQTLIDDACQRIEAQTALIKRAEQLIDRHEDTLEAIING